MEKENSLIPTILCNENFRKKGLIYRLSDFKEKANKVLENPNNASIIMILKSLFPITI